MRIRKQYVTGAQSCTLEDCSHKLKTFHVWKAFGRSCLYSSGFNSLSGSNCGLGLHLFKNTQHFWKTVLYLCTTKVMMYTSGTVAITPKTSKGSLAMYREYTTQSNAKARYANETESQILIQSLLYGRKRAKRRDTMAQHVIITIK